MSTGLAKPGGLDMSSIEHHVKKLEERVTELLAVCDSYKRQNRTLKAREAQLLEERTQLLKKNDLARVKVEAMITRLKAMEQDT
jgi:cell division protein ZapB